MHLTKLILTGLALTSLSGCVVGKVVTAPIRAAGTVVETAVDATTTTQSEREEDVGRRVLAEEEAAEKERKLREKCRRDPDECP